MNKTDKIYIAGHRGLVGSALHRGLAKKGYKNLILRTHDELDLTNQAETEKFFAVEKPDHVFMAAALVGGIHANNTYPADFIYDNLAIATNVIHACFTSGVKRLLFLGSSCIYPRLAPQPMHERELLSGPLEPTNRPYAIAKIAGVEMCWDYNRQHKTRYLAAMPTNLYGPGDTYHLENSHVIPALIRRLHEAKMRRDTSVTVWGTGTVRREFLFSDDVAEACLFLMNLPDDQFDALLNPIDPQTQEPMPPLINIGYGSDLTIKELVGLVKSAVGYQGEVLFDTTKPDGVPRKFMDSGRLRALGWKPTIDLAAGLKLAYDDFVATQEKQAKSA